MWRVRRVDAKAASYSAQPQCDWLPAEGALGALHACGMC
jgi:hypothetical protein